MSLLRALLAVAALLVAAMQPAVAADIKRGEELLTRDCARCHAVGTTGDSPHKQAPAFRTLDKRYPIESLEEALGEGIMSGHPDMPEFKFDAERCRCHHCLPEVHPAALSTRPRVIQSSLSHEQCPFLALSAGRP